MVKQGRHGESRVNDMPDLYADGARGVYIPQYFAESVRRECVRGVWEEDWKVLEAGPEHKWYWETWDEVLSNAEIVEPSGRRGQLWQDGDLWIVWEGEEMEEGA